MRRLLPLTVFALSTVFSAAYVCTTGKSTRTASLCPWRGTAPWTSGQQHGELRDTGRAEALPAAAACAVEILSGQQAVASSDAT